MVEAIVSFAIERIADTLDREASLLHGVSGQVEQLQIELKRIQCFLKDADNRQDQDERVRNLVSEIRDVAYESEDVIDTFLLLQARTGTRKSVFSFIDRLAFIFTDVNYLHEIGTRIKSIQAKIGSISTSMQTYGIRGEASRHASEAQKRLRRSYPREEDDVVGLEGSIKSVKSQLMSEEEQLRIVSIVGMGGLGKTTLAKKIYSDIQVKRYFDCHSWSFLSQQFSVRDVLVGILMKVATEQEKFELVKTEEEKLLKLRLERMKDALQRMEEERLFRLTLEKMKVETMFIFWLEKMKEEDLVEAIFDALKEKRYLVVLDDIWRTEDWDVLKHVFPKGKKGSKVLLTTRNKDIASYADPRSSPIEPTFLTDDGAWQLLSRKVFLKDIVAEYGHQLQFEELGREMVKKSGGLPLAVVVLGGVLATKKSLEEWKIVQRSINAQFIKWEKHHQYGGVYGILALSYHDLPFYLKPFFLYLSQFPEDWEIHKRELIHMWIAEGFFSQGLIRGRDETMDDLGEQYLEELVSRSMVQVSQRDYTGMGIKTLRIHDLMRDMCVLMAREENFLGIAESYEQYIMARRVAIHPQVSPEFATRYFVHLLEGRPRHRSLFYFRKQRSEAMFDIRNRSFKDFKLLRVLNLRAVDVKVIPHEIGDLIHLRYIGLRGSTSSAQVKLPKSIGNLRSLYTLDVRGFASPSLPDVLWKLEYLRHLFADWKVLKLCRMHTLRNLETLKCVALENLIRKNASNHLTNLRRLAIVFNKKGEMKTIMKSPIFSTGRLVSLLIEAKGESSFPNLEPLSHCQHLSKLELHGEIQEGLEFLPTSLAKLILKNSKLKKDPMSVLEKLLHLRFLYLLSGSYLGPEMACSENGFPQLNTLRLESLDELDRWEIKESAMPCLKHLYLHGLSKLKMVPKGITFITSLQELKASYMTKEFTSMIQFITFKQHRPTISVSAAKA